MALTPFDIYLDNVHIQTSVLSSSSTSSSITLGKSSYYQGQTGSASWTVADSDWSIFYSTRLEVLFGGKVLSSVPLSTQTGTTAYQFDQIGPYVVRLQKYRGNDYINSGTFGFSGTTIATTNIPVYVKGTAYLFVPNNIPVGMNFLVNFSQGYVPSEWASSWINVYHKDINNNWVLESSKAYLPFSASDLSTQLSVGDAGDYLFELYETDIGKLASDTATALLMERPLEINISSTFLNVTTGSSYVRFDNLLGVYGIDNANYTNYSTYYEVYNYNYNTSYSRKSLIRQQDKINIFLNYLLTGNFKLSLYAENGSVKKELAFVNFTISATNAAGYGIIIDKNIVAKGDSVSYQLIMPPGTSTVFNFVRGSDSKLLRTANYSNTTSGLIDTSFMGLDNYYLILIDYTGIEQARTAFRVVNATVTPVPTSGGTADCAANPQSLACYSTGETGDDFAGQYKSWVYDRVGRSEASLFFVSIIHMLAFGALAIVLTKGKIPAFGVVGAILGMGWSVSLHFIALVWAVIVLILAGLVLLKIMGKG